MSEYVCAAQVSAIQWEAYEESWAEDPRYEHKCAHTHRWARARTHTHMCTPPECTLGVRVHHPKLTTPDQHK